ncbi:sodium-coupled monocarboxylate transporter 2-like [Ruditapes philippinarum]|uniref:sodium-coupled monocarboxylate transporter 2-like n=1 Tax=Ruditapes philippinarum TaxID=129788 RepID=UPI00295B47FD|nr:sodium-coupled monocarboxylate transporter 2-like [Ruditapes philippinarum]
MDTETLARSFSVPDFVVFGLLIFISVAIGVFFALRDKKHNTTENYFLGDRKLSSLPVGLSFVVSFQSSILILGFPAEAYAYGLQYAMQCVGVICGYLLAALIVVPIFHPLKVTSVYEYYFLRYKTNSVRYVAVTLGVIHYTFYMGIVMYGTALALESVAKLPMWSSILIFSTSSIIYTSIGGFKAVIWTDVFQSLVMLVGILAVLIKTTTSAGGMSNVLIFSKARLNFFNFDPDPTLRHTFWTLVIGAPSQFLHLAITQAGIQRINSTPSIGTARKIFYIAAPIYSLTWILVMIQGLGIFAYFSNKGCDPLASGQVENLNQIIPFTILELFHDYPGLPGLFIAALAAASLSTISSGLSSLSAVTYEDFIKVFLKGISDEKGANISKAVVVIYGLISVGFAFLLSNVEGPLGQIMASFMGAITGPELGLFLTSVFFRRARAKAVNVSTFIGICLVLWMIIGQNFSASIPKTPYLPLGPTDQCPISETYNISNVFDYLNQTFVNISTTISNVTPSLNQTASTAHTARTGLETFYSISYMYFHLIGCILVIFLSVIISLFTQPEFPEPVSDKTVLPFSIFVPPCLKSNYDLDSDSSDIQERESMIQMKHAGGHSNKNV